jgi:hypothetical protein
MTEPRIRYQLSVVEAAGRLGVSEGAVRQRIRRGTLDVRRKGRRLVVLLSEADVKTPHDATGPKGAEAGDDTRTVQVQRDHTESASGEPAGEAMVPRSELERANRAYDELAEAWARDLRHQLERLEREVDRLQGELSEMRQRHAEEMRRKDVLLQGNQEALATWIARLGAASANPAPKT